MKPYISFLLNNLTPGQLQAGYNTTYVQKRGNDVKHVTRKISGTGIPASFFTRLKSGEFKNISRFTKRKLYNLYRRVGYAVLKKGGTPANEARNIPTNPEDLINKAQKFLEYAGIISENKKIPLEIILASMTQSKKSEQDFDIYIRKKDYSRIPRVKRRTKETDKSKTRKKEVHKIKELKKMPGKNRYHIPGMGTMQIDAIYTSTRKGKKYMVAAKKGDKVKIVHFGDMRYSDYTEHKDEKRRDDYLNRTSKIRDKKGKLTKNDKFSANYWARKILWDSDRK